jgi:hypothetical protein
MTNKEILQNTDQNIDTFTPYGNKVKGIVLLVDESMLNLNYIEQLIGYLTVRKQRLLTVDKAPQNLDLFT